MSKQSKEFFLLGESHMNVSNQKRWKQTFQISFQSKLNITEISSSSFRLQRLPVQHFHSALRSPSPSCFPFHSAFSQFLQHATKFQYLTLKFLNHVVHILTDSHAIVLIALHLWFQPHSNPALLLSKIVFERSSDSLDISWTSSLFFKNE